jgi:hypothetical protein
VPTVLEQNQVSRSSPKEDASSVFEDTGQICCGLSHNSDHPDSPNEPDTQANSEVNSITENSGLSSPYHSADDESTRCTTISANAEHKSFEWIDLPESADANQRPDVSTREYTESRLCEKCHFVFNSWARILELIYKQPLPVRKSADRSFPKPSSISFPHWENFGLFEKAAQRGRHLCVQLLYQIQSETFSFDRALRTLNRDDTDHLSISIGWTEGAYVNQYGVREEESRASRQVTDLALKIPALVNRAPAVTLEAAFPGKNSSCNYIWTQLLTNGKQDFHRMLLSLPIMKRAFCRPKNG